MRLIKAALAVVFAAFLANCGGPDNPTVNLNFFNDSSLNLATKSRESGDNLVFKWEFIHPEDGNVDDDELTEVIYFEAPGGSDRFSALFNSGVNIPILYDRLCVCPSDTYTIIGGFIEATLVNEGEWRVVMAVDIQNGEGLVLPIQDEGNYTIGN